jgi:hypothetical protein
MVAETLPAELPVVEEMQPRPKIKLQVSTTTR